MKQRLYTGEPMEYTYKDHLEIDAHCKHRRTERAQRREIEEHLDTLTEQHDYITLDLIRTIARELATETSPRCGVLLYMMWKLMDDSSHDDIICHYLSSSARETTTKRRKKNKGGS